MDPLIDATRTYTDLVVFFHSAHSDLYRLGQFPGCDCQQMARQLMGLAAVWRKQLIPVL